MNGQDRGQPIEISNGANLKTRHADGKVYLEVWMGGVIVTEYELEPKEAMRLSLELEYGELGGGIIL
jgi:hypothetical protein